MNTGHRIFIAVVLVIAMAMIMALMFRHHDEVRRATLVIAALALGAVCNFVLDLVRTIIGKEGGSDES